MDPKRTKYDTNPLDHGVADRATESFESNRADSQTGTMDDRVTQAVRGAVNEPARVDPESESPTRLMDNSYPSVFVKPLPQQTYEAPRVTPPNIYQPPPGPVPGIYQRPPLPVSPQNRTVVGLGMPERWANLLPYIPGHIGAVAAVIELLLTPRTEVRARFHAAQGLALQLFILIITIGLGILGAITDSSLGSGIFRLAATVFLIVSMIRAFKGRTHHIAPLDDATKWLDEKIKPRK